MKQLSKTNNPAEYEKKWAEYWLENKTFSSAPDNRKPYSIVIPPPNITGALHMGHALNNVIQDIVIRFHKINGFNTMWQPGTDHGGIATQNVVERLILEEDGRTRTQMGREKFLERMEKWKEESGGTIINQLKMLGCGCDWDRMRFTMDGQCSKAVTETFVTLFEEGLIYRGEYMINFCPRCRTALSDIELENEPRQSKLWHIKYPIAGEKDSYVTVATTRPETMLGDTAVAVNPSDKRYKNLEGKKISLPLTGRDICVIKDDFVDPAFGSGVVKVTPAHDPNDFDMGRRHSLEFVKVIDEEARMTEEAGKFSGMDRFECRKKILEELEKLELLEKTEDYTHAPGLCYRCSTLIEPLISEQWFLKMKDIASAAIKVSEEKKVKFIPSIWEKPYLNWLENIHDWCISRQIWWGHRIPVYYCEKGCGPFALRAKPDSCPDCGRTVRQDEDVLDTWFSSALWPFSTLGWPEETEDLKYYYPTKVLVTGHEILYLWVARMIMMGLKLRGDIPFAKVNIHGMIRDEKGEKMSKSKGNVIDPMDIVKEYGTDALRFSLAKSAVPGRDLQLSDDDFIAARNFMNKLHNAARLIIGEMEVKDLQLPEVADMELADKWILSELETFTDRVYSSYRKFNNASACRLIYEFVWNYFCDWYLELAKLRLYSEGQQRQTVQKVLLFVLVRILNLMHPVTPFITSQIWEYISIHAELPGKTPLDMNGKELKTPDIPESDIGAMRILMDIISSIRNIRGEVKIQPAEKLNVSVKAETNDKELIYKYEHYIKQLAGVEKITVGSEIKRKDGDAVEVVGKIAVFVEISESMRSREINRIEKRISEINSVIAGYKKKLGSRDFIEKAPEEVVRQTRERASEYQDELDRLEKNIRGIKK